MKSVTPAVLGILVTVFAAFVYGFYPAATRAAYTLGINAVFMVMFGLLCRSAVMSGYCVATGKKLFASRTEVKDSIINGAYQFVQLGTILWAMMYLPGPVVITIMFTYTTLLYLYMVFRGEEFFSAPVLLTVIVALAGIALVVNMLHADVAASVTGLLIAAASAVVTAARIYIFGNAFKTRNPAVVGAEAYSVAFLFSCAFMIIAPPDVPDTFAGWAWACAGGASLAVGGFAALYGLALLGTFKFAFFIKLEPVFGAIISAVLIHEILDAAQYAGIALVVGSLLVYQYLQRKISA